MPNSRFRKSVASSTAFVFLAVASLIVMNELSRLTGEVLSKYGHTHELADIIGFTAPGQSRTWASWWSADGASSAATFITVSTSFDLLFILCYLVLGFRLIRFAIARWNEGEASPVSALKGSIPLIVLGALDVAEDVLIFVLAGHLGDAQYPAMFDVLPWFLIGFTIAKLAAAILVLLHFVLSDAVGSTVRSFLRNAVPPLYAQRLSLIVVGAVAALSLIPKAGLFEQISDAYRGWVTFAAPSSPTPTIDFQQVLSALGAYAITGLSLFLLGRQRARHYGNISIADGRPAAKPWHWFVPPVAIALIGLLIDAASGWQSVDWGVVAIFGGAVAVFPLASIIILWLRRNRPSATDPDPFISTDFAANIDRFRMTGDLLVAVWLAIGMLGPFKALLSPLFLAAVGDFPNSRFEHSFGALLTIEVILLVAAIALPTIYRYLVARLIPVPIVGAPASPVTTGFGIAILCVSVAAVVGLLIAPVLFGTFFGPVGTLVLLIGCWATLIGLLIIALGQAQPLTFFRSLKLRTTPVITLLIVIPLAVSFIDGPATLHAIRTSPTRQDSPQRSGLAAAFRDWNTSQKACATELDDGPYVRPLVLVAAEGGGIRAATWTVDVVRQLAGAGVCAANATLLSSGASGGSIGLATFRSGNGFDEQSKVTTEAYGGPDALAADMAGLLDGDLVGGVTGVRVPTATDLEHPFSEAWAWHDRTALQEMIWQQQAPQFDTPYDITRETPTGYLVLNSTDSISNCKVIVSQLDLRAARKATLGTSNCNGPGVELSNTIDLQDYIGDCIFNLNWSTAAELSARFPVISPPGRVAQPTLAKNCNQVKDAKHFQEMQLVDGGIADNSAIGTISDLSPELAKTISSRNSTADGTKSRPFVVPILVFASNEPGLDLTVAPTRSKPDALVPIAAIQNVKSALVSPSAWLTRVANGLSQVCVGYSSVQKATDKGYQRQNDKCIKAVAGVRGLIPEGIAVVSPSTGPAVSVPLGWTLSGYSRTRLRIEALAQTQCRAANALTDATCRANRGYGKLGSVLDLLSLPSQPALVK
jgi:hypothetical protein